MPICKQKGLYAAANVNSYHQGETTLCIKVTFRSHSVLIPLKMLQPLTLNLLARLSSPPHYSHTG